MSQCRSTYSALVRPNPYYSPLCSTTVANSHSNLHPGVHVDLHLCMLQLHPSGGDTLLPTAVHSICPRTYSIGCSSSLLAYGTHTYRFGLIIGHACRYISHIIAGDCSNSSVHQQPVKVPVTVTIGNTQVAAIRPIWCPALRVPRP